MTVACWRKMGRRIHSWASQGFIYQLAEVTPTALRDHVQNYQSEKEAESSGKPRVPDEFQRKRNITLYSLLKSLKPSDIKAILNQIRYTLPVSKQQASGNIDKLMAALEAMAEGTSETPVYNEDTCVEFHHLLIALLLGYGRSLDKLSKLEKEESEAARRAREAREAREREARDAASKEAGKQKEVKKDKKAAKQKKEHMTGSSLREEQVKVWEETASSERASLTADVWNYTRLLWRIISSQIFRDHMHILEKKTIMKLPQHDEFPKYSAWVDFGGGVGHDDDDGGGVDANLVASRADSDAAPVNPHFKTFKSWLWLNTSHLSTLEKLSMIPGMPEIKVNLMEMTPVDYAGDKMEWGAYIEKILEPVQTLNAVEVRTMLQEEIDSRVYKYLDSDSGDTSGQHDIAFYFGHTERADETEPTGKHQQIDTSKQTPRKRTVNPDLMVGQTLTKSNKHCELDFGALIEFKPVEVLDEKLLEIMRVSYDTISIGLHLSAVHRRRMRPRFQCLSYAAPSVGSF
jgi:hypothetical protein